MSRAEFWAFALADDARAAEDMSASQFKAFERATKGWAKDRDRTLAVTGGPDLPEAM